ncbi:MAG: HAD-IIA family hydrolase [Ruminococcaceae bacterium]|nr:HAD-IIA family hydrolase [Oscillospiraceae bacterium]
MAKNPIFDNIKYFILDMDGTFYLGTDIIDGSLDFLKKVRETGKDFCFFTNNSSNNVEVCRTKLHNMGCEADSSQIVISSHVTIDYLKRNYPGKTVYLLGNERLTNDFINAGITLDDTDPDIVVLGFDTTLNYEKIHKACRFLAEGRIYIATHPDFNCPTADGFMPDTGSMMAMFKASTGRDPVIMGKPYYTTVEYLTHKLGCKPEELCFVGDRLETDIAIGFNHSLTSVLVLTGVTDTETYAASSIRASFVAESLKKLSEEL